MRIPGLQKALDTFLTSLNKYKEADRLCILIKILISGD